MRVMQDSPVSRRAKTLARRIEEMGWELHRSDTKNGWRVVGPPRQRLLTTTRLNVLSRWVRYREGLVELKRLGVKIV